MAKIKAILSSGKITSNAKPAFSLFSESRFGEKVGEKITYSLVEALFLVEEKKMEIYSKNRKLDNKKMMREFEKLDQNFYMKYVVFRDMRKKGYIVKSALKFGAEFRVYQKGASLGEDHALWILYPVSENSQLTWHDFSAKNRVAHSTNKKLLIGVVDEEEDVSYYEIRWMKP